MMKTTGTYKNGIIFLDQSLPLEKEEVPVVVKIYIKGADPEKNKPEKDESKRVFGYHRGIVTYIADDFDDPLPDDFWLGEE